MDKTGLSGEPADLSLSPSGEIPEARRDTPTVERPPAFTISWPRWRWRIGLFAIALILVLIGNGVVRSLSSSPPVLTLTPTAGLIDQMAQNTLLGNGIRFAETLLGHLAYEEVSPDLLKPIVADGSIKLRQGAAEKFSAMVAAAQGDGIDLFPISGYRSVEDQEYLFFELKAQRGQVATERAEVTAPPGYSEHHTGYAVDVGDGRQRETDLDQSFETTDAFRWLQDNAAYYSFELSFPKNNARGISYEPWHWRFVGDRTSLETFYKARQLTGDATP